MESAENIAPAVVKLVSKQMLELVNRPPEGIVVLINDDNVTDVQAWIGGPESTGYEGGYFRVKVVLVTDFPVSPPKCYFLTKIYHPNISETGEVCVNSLKRDWKCEYGVAHILLIVRALLYQPNPESALNQEAAMSLIADLDGFVREAKLMTSIHASHAPPDVQRALEPANGNKINRGTSGGSSSSSSSAQVATKEPKKRRVHPMNAAAVQLKKIRKQQLVDSGGAAATRKIGGGTSSMEKIKVKESASLKQRIGKVSTACSAGGDALGAKKKRPQAGRHDEENISEAGSVPANERSRRP